MCKSVKFDPIKSSNQILYVSMLQIYNLKYSRYFFIIKCVGLEAIFLLLTLMLHHPLTVFNTFNYVFLSIVLLISVNKFIFKNKKKIYIILS